MLIFIPIKNKQKNKYYLLYIAYKINHAMSIQYLRDIKLYYFLLKNKFITFDIEVYIIKEL